MNIYFLDIYIYIIYIGYLCIIGYFWEGLSLAVVSACFYEHPYGTDRDVLLLLFLLRTYFKWL